MKKYIVSKIFPCCLFIYLILMTKNAFAYIDPGTGSYVIQIVLAVLFGSLFMLKTYWKMVKTFLRNIFSKKEKNGEVPE